MLYCPRVHNHFFTAAALSSFVLSLPTAANSVFVGGDVYDYRSSLDDIAVDYTPVGGALGGTIDVSETMYLQLMLGRWGDDGADNRVGSSSRGDFSAALMSAGMGYQYENWRFYASYSHSEDDLDIRHGAMAEFLSTQRSESDTLRVDANYLWEMGRWAYAAQLGVQYDSSENRESLDQSNTNTFEDSDSYFVNLKLSTDYYVGISDNSGFYLGAGVNWFDRVSFSSSGSQTVAMGPPMPVAGGNPPPPPPPRPGGGGGGGRGDNGGNANRTSGSSYGIASLYAVYDLNQHWSLDWQSTFGFAGDENLDAHALTLSYYF